MVLAERVRATFKGGVLLAVGLVGFVTALFVLWSLSCIGWACIEFLVH